MEKILELKEQGKVLICTSHVPETLKRLCNKALWLDRGAVARQGPMDEVLDAYLASASADSLKESQ